MISVKAVYDKQLGSIRVVDKDKPEFHAYKNSLAHGAEVELQIKIWHENKTGRQNRLFHALIGRYCATLGFPFEETKVKKKYEYGTWITAERAIKDCPPWNGRFIETEDGICFLKSWADYDIQEGRTAIDCMIKDCITSGVKIDDIIKEFDLV